MWVLYTIAATLALSLSVVFAKCGSKKADSSVITALRTLVVVIFMWVFIFVNDLDAYIPVIGGTSFLYLILSGLALFGAILCYHISLRSGSVTGVSALEKLTTVLMIAAIFISKYTADYYIQIICIVLIAVGIILVITKRARSGGSKWILFGILTALASVATYLLADFGVSVKSSILSLTLMLTVVLVASLVAVFIRGLQHGIGKIPMSEFMFIILSGLAAGLGWLCFRTAYIDGHTNTVLAITSMTVATSPALAALFLKEKVSWKSICGILLIITGTLMYVFMV